MFGNDPRYVTPLPITVCTYLTAFPGYRLVYYVTKDDLRHEWLIFLKKLEERGLVSVVMRHRNDGLFPTAYRFDAAWNKDADVVFCRDVDGLLSTREYLCMRDFIDSDYEFYTYRSHPHHTALLMAGMCGFKSPWVRKNVARPELVGKGKWGCDQTMLDLRFRAHASKMAEYLGEHGEKYCGFTKEPSAELKVPSRLKPLLDYADHLYASHTCPLTKDYGFENMPYEYKLNHLRGVLEAVPTEVRKIVTSAMQGLACWA